MADGGRKVLVVEDEAVIRQAAVEMVEEAGFQSLEATNGTDAFRILHDVADISAVLTDIDMPAGLDGIRLAACIAQRWPQIGLVVTSGKVRPRRGDLPTGTRFFTKPYNEQDVIAALRRVVANPRGSKASEPRA